jgi:hypothetical protein
VKRAPAMFIAVPPTVGSAITILPVPNALERAVDVVVASHEPHVKVNPFKFIVPPNKIKLPVLIVENAVPKVVTPVAPLLIDTPATVELPLFMIVPVPTITIDKLVKIPDGDNVNEFKLMLADGTVNAVVPKFRLLKKLAVVSVMTLVPLPVNVTFGELVVVPDPPVPNVNVLVIDASVVKPPVPVYVKLVAFAILSTVVPAVVCANTMLLVPNAIERTPVPVELKIPTVKSYPPKFNVPAVKIKDDVAVKVCVPSNVSVPPTKLKPRPPSCLLN